VTEQGYEQEYEKYEDADPPPDDRQQRGGDTEAPRGGKGDDPGPPEDYEETIRQIEEQYPTQENT
jgi:hypothetical protein